MTLDEVVSNAKSDFKAILVEYMISGLGLTPLMTVPVLGPLLSVFLFRVAGIVADKIDLGGYYLYKLTTNLADASNYQDSIRESRIAAQKGNEDEIAKARAIQRERFAKCMLLSA